VADDNGRWRVEVSVVPKAGVNDPEGEAILGGLQSLGFAEVERVRAGRLFMIELDAASDVVASARAREMAERLLANPVIQSFAIGRIERAEPAG
jgi:phosphoribosylformylglycinamidine synthase